MAGTQVGSGHPLIFSAAERLGDQRRPNSLRKPPRGDAVPTVSRQ